MIKAKPILSRWLTYRLEKNNTKEIDPLLWRFRVPCEASQSEDPEKALRIPREPDVEGQKD